jgi:hypothetical protein
MSISRARFRPWLGGLRSEATAVASVEATDTGGRERLVEGDTLALEQIDYF